MSVERNFISLNLVRDCIESVTEDFCKENSLTIRSVGDKPGSQGRRIVIGRVGCEDATLDVYFNKDGTSTLTYKIGKNIELGLALADKLYQTIDPAEFQSINMTLKGISRPQIQTIIELLEEDENNTFSIEITEHNTSLQWKIHCEEHGDSLTITHHASLRLQIQGKPLTCYRKLVYLLTDILDLAGLELVLSRSEENSTVVVRKEVAAEFLKKMLPNSYDNLPGLTRDLLVSGQCVKLAGPSLPEYSMLLFPELRSLEGALKSKLASFGFDSDSQDFGYFFGRRDQDFELRASFNGHITDAKLREDLSKAYTFFSKHRHGLFHMNSFEESSRKISTISNLMALSDEAYIHLDNLYRQ